MKFDSSSFRDPSGYVFYIDGEVYRQINQSYKKNYDMLMSTGLYQRLVNEEMLVCHTEVSKSEFPDDYALGFEECYKVIKPDIIPFVSYPYEWCFSQLKNAALLTLRIQKTALENGMSLKDASSYNIQFVGGKPIFIDTLSFEKYKEGEPWVAYRQFCQHFLAPLSLMALKDIRLNQLLRIYIDGIPLDLASSLLPFKSHFKLTLKTHIHFHAKTQRQYSDKTENIKGRKISRLGLLGIVENLETAIKRLRIKHLDTEWANYYEDNNNYSSPAMEDKEKIVSRYLDKIKPSILWDLGANTGKFSRIASNKGAVTISFDIDPMAVERNFLCCLENGEKKILPLLLDLTNPTPSIGWENEERLSVIDRGPADTALALALIHHLAISNNLPFKKIVDFFSKITNWLIIEFVPKEDSQVQKLLATREDIFPSYTQSSFEKEFCRKFDICEKDNVSDSARTLYLMKKK